MADADDSTRKESKRKRSTAFLEPEELTADIVHKLEACRAGLDRKLAKYNEEVMKTQAKGRQSFIKSCEERINDLPEGVRSTVAAQLLADEEFAAGMDFFEVGTSDNKSGALSWSAGGTSLSETSWRTMLKRHVEGAPSPSSAAMHMLVTATQATSKDSSSHESSSTALSESMGPENSMSLSDSRMPKSQLTEDDDRDGEDILFKPDVRISKPRTVKKSQGPASLESKLPSPRERRAVAKQGRSPKPQGFGLQWSNEDFEILKHFCHGNTEASKYLNRESSDFWNGVSAQLHMRSPNACCQKWRKSTLGGRAPKNRQPSARSWSQEELSKISEKCSKYGPRIDWAEVASHFPDRSEQACERKHREQNHTGGTTETPSG